MIENLIGSRTAWSVILPPPSMGLLVTWLDMVGDSLVIVPVRSNTTDPTVAAQNIRTFVTPPYARDACSASMFVSSFCICR